MKAPTLNDFSGNPDEGERKTINSELWHACAGPLVSLPPVGSLVVYFPQGHSEQVAASMKKDTDSIPSYPSLPSKIVCVLHNVILHADPETDEVYAQMTLQPVNNYDKEALLASELGLKQIKQPSEFFCKTLTASDTSTHGGFSVPRRAAEKIFPPLDFSMQPPAQELVAKDLHDVTWTFRHIYRGQPKRHLLTTGWSVFVSSKRLFAGDSVLFIRDEKSQLLLGVKRANRQQPALSSSVLPSDSMHIGILAAAAHAAASNSPFTIFYNPRASPSEFVVPLAKYLKAMYTQISLGMRFRMMFETEESGVRRYMGTVTGISDLDTVRWKNSQWRNLQVGWDESTAGERRTRVSIWEIEPVATPFYICPPPFLRPKFFKPPGMPDDSDADNAFRRTMPWLGDDFGKEASNPFFPGFSLVQWMAMQQNSQLMASAAQSVHFPSLAASAVQNTSTDDPSRLLSFQINPLPPQNLQFPSKVAQQPQLMEQQPSLPWPQQQQLQQQQQPPQQQQQFPTVSLSEQSQKQQLLQQQINPNHTQEQHHQQQQNSIFLQNQSQQPQQHQKLQGQLPQNQLQDHHLRPAITQQNIEPAQKQHQSFSSQFLPQNQVLNQVLQSPLFQVQQQGMPKPGNCLSNVSSLQPSSLQGISQVQPHDEDQLALLKQQQLQQAQAQAQAQQQQQQQQQHSQLQLQLLQKLQQQQVLSQLNPQLQSQLLTQLSQQSQQQLPGTQFSQQKQQILVSHTTNHVKPESLVRANSTLSENEGPSCSTSPSANFHATPSSLLKRNRQGPSIFNEGVSVRPLDNQLQEIQSKSDGQMKHELHCIKETDQLPHQHAVSDQLDASSASSFCMDAAAAQEGFSLPPLCMDSDVPEDNRNNFFIGATNDGLVMNTLPTRGLSSGKDIENMLSGYGNQKDIDAEVSTAAISSQSFGIPDMSFRPGCSGDPAANESRMYNRGMWANQQPQRMRTYTKVQKRGSVGRSIDVTRYIGYDDLRHDLARMFGIEGQLEDPHRTEWKLVYVDHENDILLVGDDPWEEFVGCVQSIKILSPVEVQQMSLDGDLASVPPVQNQACSGSDNGNVWRGHFDDSAASFQHR